MYLIAGLGNPGLKYSKTRHNVGFMFIDALSKDLSIKVDRAKFSSLLGDAVISGEKCMLIKPLTFMNNSGHAVSQVAGFYKIPPENIIVVYDDVSLDIGSMRIRLKGSSGGQKGMQSIIDHLNTSVFARIKIGIGEKPYDDYLLSDYVLSKFNRCERKVIDSVINNAVSA
ncbi:MAG: aminoacyl-tRNA hydrolase, partial [Oscillospiraceae bacterium]|nr:aminoacyl-tRNA hydrolase [Oscillospiraceae bacterium]